MLFARGVATHTSASVRSRVVVRARILLIDFFTISIDKVIALVSNVGPEPTPARVSIFRANALRNRNGRQKKD